MTPAFSFASCAGARIALILALFSGASLATALAQTTQAQSIGEASAQAFLRDIKTLSAPNMEGRGDGYKGLTRARDYIAQRYASLGLEPKGTNGFFQPFDLVNGTELTADNRFTVRGPGLRQALSLRADYIPYSVSAPGSAAGGLVFAGYGITADEWKYDDYAGIDVKDKIVVILRGEPPLDPAKAPKVGSSEHGDLFAKAILARKHGALAVVVVNGKLKPGEADVLAHFGGEGSQTDVGIPILQVKNVAAQAWFRAAGTTLGIAQNRIDGGGAPASFTLPGTIRASLTDGVRKKHAEVSNVVAYLPGASDEYIVIGAHYDHLGRGEYGSLAPSRIGELFPGADDNASGTAALMEVARLLAPYKGKLPRGVLFISFAGEELGLLGSAQWVRAPTLPIDKAVAMINMDMVGRVQNDTIYIGGVGTSSAFQAILDKTTATSGLKPAYSLSGYSSSDETSFLVKQIPVLFFFSGLHSDYHKPSDTWDKIDPAAGALVTSLVAHTVLCIDDLPARPAYVAVADPHPAGAGSGRGGGYGPYFGSIPDFAQIPNGVRFSDVRPGSPAAKAGLKPGDVLTSFRDQPIHNLYDFTDALRHSNVGDVVTVTVLRDGKPLTVQVTLEARK